MVGRVDGFILLYNTHQWGTIFYVGKFTENRPAGETVAALCTHEALKVRRKALFIVFALLQQVSNTEEGRGRA